MALAVDSTGNQATTSTNVNSTTFNNVGGNALFVVVCPFDSNATNRQVSSITYNSVNLTSIPGAITDLSTGQRVEIWYLNSPATGSHTLTITMKGSIVEIDAGWITFSGAATDSSVVNASTAGTSGTNSITTTISPTVTNTYILGGAQSLNNPMTIDASSTSLFSLGGQTSRGQYKSIAATGNTSLTNTTSSSPDAIAMGLIAVAPPASGGTPYKGQTFPLLGVG